MNETQATATLDTSRMAGGVAVPIVFSFLRVPLIALSAAATIGLFALGGYPVSFPTSPLVSALYLLPVNILSLLLVRWALRRSGRTLGELVGFDRTRLGRDILWGLLWLAVLYVPFAAAIIGTMFALYGAQAFQSFEAVFVPAVTSTPALPFAASLVLAIVVVLTFAPLNAPTEELVYRGFAQGGIQAATGRRALAVLIPAIGFGIQHLFFAPTPAGMLVFGVAFFAWGIGSGLIYLKQRRLMPLVVCHFVVNLFTSVPALAVPFLMAG